MPEADAAAPHAPDVLRQLKARTAEAHVAHRAAAWPLWPALQPAHFVYIGRTPQHTHTHTHEGEAEAEREGEDEGEGEPLVARPKAKAGNHAKAKAKAKA
eukprot:scaffold123436_cov60-Phaeocystis_antarctica.AAC.1